VEMDEENYFFKLSNFERVILNYLNSGDIRPESVRKEWLNFLVNSIYFLFGLLLRL
jgi:methionyl-tRNA synthetase